MFVNGRGVMPHGQKQNQRQRGNGRGQGNPEISLELVPHGAALTVAGGNGGVGDEGQVVAEHGPAHDASGTQRRVKAGRLGDLQGDGHDEGDGADGGSHSGGDKAGHHKQHRHGKPGGDDVEHEVGDALGGAAPHHADERPCRQKDQQHGDDVLISHALPHDNELFLKGNRPVLKTGY